MSEKVKIGIIGVGTIGSVHAEAYAKVPEAEIMALCDILPDRLKEKGSRHGVATLYEDYHELLANPDIEAVSVCVPNNVHAPIAIDAFKAGKHVLLEKPMALNAQQGEAICKARDDAGRVLMMGMVMRQGPDARLVHDAVAAGKLGDIYQIRMKLIRRRGIPGLGGWFTTKAESGGGGLIDIGVHFFDLSMWMSGLWNPTRASAATYAKFGMPMEDYHYIGMWAGPPDYSGTFDVDDYAAGFVRFGEQATLSFEVAWACNSQEESYLELLGTKAGVKVSAGGSGGNLVFCTEVDDKIADVSVKYNPNRDKFAAEMAAFVNAVMGRGEPAATGEQGVTNMRLIDAIYKSAAAGQEVDV